MKRVLYSGGFELPDKNAAAQRVMANALLLRKMKYEVSFIGISKDIKKAPHIVNGFISNPVSYPMGITKWVYQILSFVDATIIIKNKPDYVVLYNFPSIASLRILRICHKHGIKVFQDITEWEEPQNKNVRDYIRWLDVNLRMHYCLKKMDGIIAISKFLYNYYSSYTKCILVPPTIDIENKKWNRNSKITTSSVVRLIYAGTAGFGVKDRLDIIVNAVSQFSNMHLDVYGMTESEYILGYGNLPQECTNIVFHGRVSHIDALFAVQNADFQLLIRDKNRKNNAGFPTKFVESMACGTPLIATLTSNIADYILDSKNGFVVNDYNELDSVLQKISEMPKSDIIKMKNSCRNLNVFDYRNYEKEFMKLFK